VRFDRTLAGSESKVLLGMRDAMPGKPEAEASY
jgi:hypothetical protein